MPSPTKISFCNEGIVVPRIKQLALGMAKTTKTGHFFKNHLSQNEVYDGLHASSNQSHA